MCSHFLLKLASFYFHANQSGPLLIVSKNFIRFKPLSSPIFEPKEPAHKIYSSFAIISSKTPVPIPDDFF